MKKPNLLAEMLKAIRYRVFFTPLIFLIFWQFAAAASIVNPRFVPAPSTVLESWRIWIFGSRAYGMGYIYSGTWITHVIGSSWRVIAGFILASWFGIGIGLLIGWLRLANDLLEPIINILRPIPITSWVPFAVVFFGIGDLPAIFLIALGAFFPIVVNTQAGVKTCPLVLIRAAQMLGTKSLRLIYRVVIPAALPSIFTGLRLGIGISWVLVIVAEMLAVKSGLGFVLWDAYFAFRTDIIIASMMSVGMLGFLSDRVVIVIRDHFLRWTKGVTV